MSRPADTLVADLLDAVGAAEELVERGRRCRRGGSGQNRRCGGKAAGYRREGLPEAVPWDDVIANRIIVDHVYHRVDYQLLWNTLERDAPALCGSRGLGAGERNGSRSGGEQPQPE